MMTTVQSSKCRYTDAFPTIYRSFTTEIRDSEHGCTARNSDSKSTTATLSRQIDFADFIDASSLRNESVRVSCFCRRMRVIFAFGCGSDDGPRMDNSSATVYEYRCVTDWFFEHSC